MPQQLIKELIADFPFLKLSYNDPWEFTENIKSIITEQLVLLNSEYIIENGNAIHKTAQIEQGAVLKQPCIIGPNSFIGANAYLREAVFIGKGVKIGVGCEIKASFIMDNSAIAHFNYIGNSIIGSNVNFEAGSIAANHYNEREHKQISILFNNKIIKTGVNKFGALVGDGSRVGANAVLSPGTILPKNFIVKRLEIIEQVIPFTN